MKHFQLGSNDVPAAVRRRPARVLVAVTALALLSTSACSSSGSAKAGGSSTGGSTNGGSTTGGSSTGSSTPSTSSGSGSADVAAATAHVAALSAAINTVPPVAKVTGDVGSLKGKTVWYIPIGGAIPLLSGIGSAMADALGRIGVSVHVCDGKFQPPAIASCMQQAAQQKADAVVTGYIDYRLLSTAFDALAAKGIPVLLAGVKADAGPTVSPKLQFYDTSPTIALQQHALADAVIADSNGKAKILYIGVTDSPQTQSATPAALQYFASHCPGCTVATTAFNTSQVSRLSSLVNAALIKHPDTNYVVEAFDEASASIVSAIQSAGKSSSIKFAANGGALDSFQRVKAGTEFTIIAGGPTYSGWQFADGIVRMMTGGKPVITNAPMRVVTKSSAASLKLIPAEYDTFHWYGSDEFKTAYLTAWGVTG